jgi:hypothetical protein
VVVWAEGGVWLRAGWGGWKVGRAARDAMPLWDRSPLKSLALGPDLRVTCCCLEHAGQYSRPRAC